MPAAVYDIVIEQGATYRKTFQAEVEELDENGDSYFPERYNPINLTGAQLRMKIKGSIGGTTYLEISTESLPEDLYVTNALEGRFVINLSAEVTEAMSFTQGVYDLELEDTTGFVKRLLKGKVTLDPEVTDG